MNVTCIDLSILVTLRIVMYKKSNIHVFGTAVHILTDIIPQFVPWSKLPKITP